MRNITRIKRSVRAISPVISVLLMIAIAVIAALVAYAWVMGYMGNQTSKAGNGIQLQSFTTKGNLVLYVQNTGQGTVHLKYDGAVYVNDVLKNILLADDQNAKELDVIPIAEGQTVTLVIDYIPVPNEQLRIKIVTMEGSFIEGAGNAGQQTSQVAVAINKVGGSAASSVSPASGNYYVGQVIQLQATVGAGDIFASWTSSSNIHLYGDDSATSLVAKVNGAGTVTGTFTTATSPRLDFTTGRGQDIEVNKLSAPITVKRQQDGAGSITVTLDSLSATGVFCDVNGNPLANNELVIAAQGGSAQFCYKDSTVGTYTLTASASGYTPDSTQITIKAAPAPTPTPTTSTNPTPTTSTEPTPTPTTSTEPTPTPTTSTEPTPTPTASTEPTPTPTTSTEPTPTPTATPTATPTPTPTTSPNPQLLTILNVGYEGYWDDTNSNWYRYTDQHHGGSYSMKSSNDKEGVFTSNGINAQGATSISISFWYRLDDTDVNEFQLKLYNGASYITCETFGDDTNSNEDRWIQYTTSISDSQYLKDNFRVQFISSLGSGENVWIDDVQITVNGGSSASISDGFEIEDWEINWSVWPNPPWNYTTDLAHTGIISAKSDRSNSGYFTCDPRDATDATAIQVTFWYRLSGSLDASDFRILYSGVNNPSDSQFILVEGSELGSTQTGVWQRVTFTITDDSAMTNTFRLRFQSSLADEGISAAVWVDDVELVAIRP